jgi:hypothetical protein
VQRPPAAGDAGRTEREQPASSDDVVEDEIPPARPGVAEEDLARNARPQVGDPERLVEEVEELVVAVEGHAAAGEDELPDSAAG